MTRLPYRLLLMLLPFLGVLGCSGDLTRSKAAELISAHEDFLSARPAIYTTDLRHNSQAAIECGQGTLWEWTANLDPQLMEAGQRFYEIARTNTSSGNIQLQLRMPPKIVEVTGITGEGQSRRVEFRWEYDGINSLPSEVSRCIEAVGGANQAGIAGSLGQTTGAADFQLYDDGWRIVLLQLHP